MNKRIDHGFSLMELVVTLAIIAILAAILTPVISNYVEQARITRANDEGQTLAKAVLNFYEDTGKWPIFTSGVNPGTGTSRYSVLSGPGTYPPCDSTATTCTTATWNALGSSIDQISNALEFNKPGGTANSYTTLGKFAWRGPYLTNIGSDPWGYSFVVNAGALAFGANQAAYVISAGPNSKIETAFTQNIGTGSSAFVVGGDDIVTRIR